ncbi:3-oxoacyl-[acyl-carrier-protein] synthase 3 A, chloroplastic-like isoform X1 [Andrographis paniculata]|uniref:3-oxoacyl-[acyl-carrier-protein] synthase 3 A, chloroplastic-like isoform X1 n=1 Tax=Andrographis paniculata TaxID=175694 RepID=UPI0021E8A3D1|nr:3-oxoacyl-[acyl-carrier-protein] synthase 3 A, chloroplastic-like isoform X1 [Andrographis paniculata]
MANASGLFTPTEPNVRRRFSPGVGICRKSGICVSSDVVYRRSVCCRATGGVEKLSPSESRALRLISRGCKLVGCGSAVPSFQISNDDLSKIVDTNDEWISVRTGIRNRRILSVSLAKTCSCNFLYALLHCSRDRETLNSEGLPIRRKLKPLQTFKLAQIEKLHQDQERDEFQKIVLAR